MSTYSSLAGAPLDVAASPTVRAALKDLARTEDLRFSPDGRRLAIAGYADNLIHILELSPLPKLGITSVVEVHCTGLAEPHGVDWFDNTRLAIANRVGFVQIVGVPVGVSGHNKNPIDPITTIDRAARWNRIKSPGSLAIERHSDTLALWVCNNYSNRMTYHVLDDDGARITVRDNAIKLKDTLDVPDGVAISQDARFMAISNHVTHQVFTYALTAPGVAKRIGELGGIDYPHGLRFTADGSALIVADAGQPFLGVFKTQSDWSGVHSPDRHVRVIDDETYLRGRYNPMEGGIKGLDIDTTRGIVATTCEFQPLQFFRLCDVLGDVDGPCPSTC